MTQYELLVGEPWNFKGPDGSNRLLVEFGGIVSGPENSKWMLLKAMTPFQYDNELVEFMIAYPRHRGNTIYEIVQEGGLVGVARIRPNVSVVSDRPFLSAEIEYFLIGNLTSLQENQAID